MPSKRSYVGLSAILAILAVNVFVTCTNAVAQTETVLHSFPSHFEDGALPYAGLIFDSSGNLYGTTQHGGTHHSQYGIVFELTPGTNGAWNEKVLYSFCSVAYCGDGVSPYARLIFDSAGNLYGTTEGGARSGGNVFELTPRANGQWSEKVIHCFCLGGDGYYPYGSLIFDSVSNLYGTTSRGGASNQGTVFELKRGANGEWTEKVLYSFMGGADGALPSARLIFDSVGNLYGTTANGAGTVFELTPGANGKWTKTELYSFTGGADGSSPYAGLIFDGAGNLYGTTIYGGNTGCTNGCGVVFELTPAASGAWTEQVLYSFIGGSDGANPYADLIFDSSGNLYGTTTAGGSGYGTAFELTPDLNGTWTEKVLYSFVSGADGANPYAGLTFDSSGNLYGTTNLGGAGGYGTVFEITP